MCELYPNYKFDDTKLPLGYDESKKKIVSIKSKRNLSITEFPLAFDRFSAIKVHYTKDKDVRKRINDLLTYKKNVLYLAASGKNWIEFDRHFRLCLAETRSENWAEIDPKMSFQYSMNSSPASSNHGPNYNFKRQTNSRATPHLKRGKCNAYNLRDQRCQAAQCTFRHECWHCGGPHPQFLCTKQAPSDKFDIPPLATQLGQHINNHQPFRGGNQAPRGSRGGPGVQQPNYGRAARQ